VLDLALEHAFAVYLIVMFALLAACLVGGFMRRIASDWHNSEEKLCYCPGCNLTFIVKRHARVAHCPRCRKRHRIPAR